MREKVAVLGMWSGIVTPRYHGPYGGSTVVILRLTLINAKSWL